MSSEGVVGPVPDHRDPAAYDRLRRRVLWSLPTGLFVVGSRGTLAGVEVANLMTANLVTQVATDPKLVAVSVEATARTAALVRAGGAFAVSLLHRDDRAVVRRFVKPVVDVETDAEGMPVTMAGEPVLTAATGAPILRRASGWLDCALHQEHPLGSHVLFVGEVVDAGETAPGGAEEPREGRGPLADVLRMEDTRMNYGG